MKKIVGVAIDGERRQIMKLLTKLGCVEIEEATDIEGLKSVSADDEKENAELKLASIAFAVDFIKSERNNAKSLVKDKEFEYKRDRGPLISPKPEIEYEDFVKLGDESAELFDNINALEELNAELIELKTNAAKSTANIKLVKNFVDFNLPLNEYRDTSKTVIRIGTASVRRLDEILALKDAFQSLEMEYYVRDNEISLVVAALREEWSYISGKLQEYEFIEANVVGYNDTAANIFKSESVNLKLIEERRKDITRRVATGFDTVDFNGKLKLMQDFYNIELQMADAQTKMLKTDKTYLFEGWIPSTAEAKVNEVLESSDYNMRYIIRDAAEGEKEPTFIIDNALVTPYQSVTNMYSVPDSKEINPNPFVMFFFVVFFGMMLSDAGYGVLITLATGIYLAIAKPRKHEMSLIKILFMGGISTVFWGIMFGSYFGIEQTLLPPILFNPIQEPMGMLILSLGLGLVQMLTGIAINAYSLFRQHRPLDAVFGAFSWYALIAGIAMFALGGKISAVKYIGIALLIVGIVMLMLSGALHKRGAKKLSGAFGSLYGLINFISDLLSYSRLFGLGLATGVIAMVFNQMAAVFIDLIPYLGYVVAIALILVGHLFNIAINTLGAYVHNSRLQYVEFFNKFYTGEGRLFRPLGSAMKNYNFVQQQEEKK